MALRKSQKKNHHILNKPVPHGDHESNWLISYADLMTLLWGFFVIISAFSTPDVDKLEKLKEKTSEAMGGEYIEPYLDIIQALKVSLNTLKVREDELKIETLSDGVRITAESARFFNSGRAQLKDEAHKIIKGVGEVLHDKARGYLTIVEGHTDDRPIKTRLFPSNWELSTRRATEVVRLFESLGVPSEDLRPVGLANIRPAISIKGKSGKDLIIARNKNRRIIIKLQKKLPQRTSK